MALIAVPWAVPARAASVFSIRGGGDGHGIGLSQYGADGYALHGRSYSWILGHYYQGTQLGQTDPAQPVRVLVADGSAAFSGATGATGYAKTLEADLTYGVRPNADGTLVLVGPTGTKLGTLAAPLTVTGPGPVSLVGVGSYRGALEFTADGARVRTVDVVALEDYVRGVVSAEMPATWSAEALKAQAVAARTYAITTDAGGSGYGLYADTRSQMYRGIAAEMPATDAAVTATRGQVVTYDGVPVVTYFSASSGGHTENIENVWASGPPQAWLRGVSDPYDAAAGNPYHRWSYRMTLARAAARLGTSVNGRLVGIEIIRRGVSPRVVLAQIVGTRGRTTVTGAKLQLAFGLLSTYVAFTTITSLPGRAAGTGATAVMKALRAAGVPPSSLQARALQALVPVVDGLVANAARGIHGTVFPAPAGRRLTIQMQTRGGWRAMGHARLRRGTYDTSLRRPGTYRIVVGGIDGPPMRVG